MNFTISPSQLINTAKNFFQKNEATHDPQNLMKMGQNAVSLTTSGKLEEAEKIYREMIAIGTTNHAVFGNLAAICGIQGRSEEAIELLNKAIELKDDYPDAHNNLGVALQRKGDINAAIDSFNTALKLKPNYPVAHYNLGTALQEQGELTAAIASFNKAIELKPDYADAHNNLGTALQKKGNPTTAISYYNTCIRLNPDYPDAYINLGNALQEQGELTAAIASFNKAITLKPDCPDAHNNLGIALHAKGNLSAAIESYKIALKIKPYYPEANNNLGSALQALGDIDGAINSYNTALKLKPNYSDAHYNVGNALMMQGRLSAALDSFNTSLKFRPSYPEAHAGLSICFLRSKNYRQGWEKYEWRSKTENPSLPHANPICPRLEDNGLSNIDKLLIVSEQGFGDTLHFMRYVLALQQRGIHTSLCAQPKLHSLIQASGIDASPLTPDQANQVTDGRWIPLLSLPMHLEVTPDNPIITEPYIHTSDDLFAKWQTILSAEQRPIIGINWQGSPTYEAKFKGRSLPLETFEPIATQTNAKLLSIQKGFGSDQLETCSFKQHFVNCQDQVNQIWDFHETAAIIANCDLIITSDTAVAHLAGGLGKSTWLLLQKIPEWRWGLEGDSTFWYPSMRLFRQSENDNWGEVIQQVTLALQEQFANNLLDS